MPAKISDYIDAKYGWTFGENGWNEGMDQNLLKFSFLFDSNVDGVVATLPPVTDGVAYFNTADNRFYFGVGGIWYSSPCPKSFIFKIKSSGDFWQFTGTSASKIDNPAELNARLNSLELTVSSLGSAAFEDVSAFATQASLDVVEALLSSDIETVSEGIIATEERFERELFAAGYTFLGNYADDLNITTRKQYFRRGDRFYAANEGTTLPYTTTGTWATDADYLVLLGDDVLRQELGSPIGASMIGRGVMAVESVSELLALPIGQRRSDLRYLVRGYHPGSNIGGGEFIYDASREAENDGGLVLSGFVRIFDCVQPEHFGAIGDGVADDSGPLQLLADALNDDMTVYSRGNYLIQNQVVITSAAHWKFCNGAGFTIDTTADSTGVVWIGGEEKLSINLSSTIAKGATSLVIEGASDWVEPGDLLWFSSGKLLSDTRDPSVFEAEANLVSAVVGDTVSLASPVYFGYTTADTGKVSVRKPLSNLRIDGISVINRGGNSLRGVKIQYFHNLEVSGAIARGGQKGVFADTGYAGRMIDCQAHNINEGLGYGLQFSNTRDAQVIRPRGAGSRHSVEFSGNCLFTKLIDPDCSGYVGGVYSWHPGSEVNTIIGGRIGGSDSISMRGQINRIRGMEFRDTAGVSFGEARVPVITRARSGENLEISGCTILGDNPPGNGRFYSYHKITDGSIERNKIKATGLGPFIRFVSGATGLSIGGNLLELERDFLTCSFVELGIASASALYSDVSINDNKGTVARWLVGLTELPDTGERMDRVEIRDNRLRFTSTSSALIYDALTGAQAVRDLSLRGNSFDGLSRISNQKAGPAFEIVQASDNTSELAINRISGVTDSAGRLSWTFPAGARPSSPVPINWNAADGYYARDDAVVIAGGVVTAQRVRIYRTSDNAVAPAGIQVWGARLA